MFTMSVSVRREKKKGLPPTYLIGEKGIRSGQRETERKREGERESF